MSKFNPFGGIFDFNHNGNFDMIERTFAYHFWDQQNSTCSQTNDSWRETCEDGSEFFIDPTDYETEEEYDEALQEARYSWRETCKDGSKFFINPMDYETEEEYEDALEEAEEDARYAWREDCDDSNDYFIDPEDYETEIDFEQAIDDAEFFIEELAPDGLFDITDPDEHFAVDETCYDNKTDYLQALSDIRKLACAVLAGEYYVDSYDPDDDISEEEESDTSSVLNPADFPNQRSFRAAQALEELNQGGIMVYDALLPERCNFILHSDTIAAKYLTPEHGFLLVQAIKENFTLPITIPDEDLEPKTQFLDFFLELVEEDVALSVKVWAWCLKEFTPHSQYMDYPPDLYSGVLNNDDHYPREFMTQTIEAICSDEEFRKLLIENSPYSPYPSIVNYIVYALQEDCPKQAQILFQAAVQNTIIKPAEIRQLIESIINRCSDWTELETMETFQTALLPLIAQIPSKHIQRLYPSFAEKAESYIHRIEEYEAYRYSRRYAWRIPYREHEEDFISPLNYKTEKEYLAAAEEHKHQWRGLISSHQLEILDPVLYETYDEYQTAVSAEQKRRADEQNAAMRCEREKVKRDKVIQQMLQDPLLNTDKTIYTFCGVVFLNGNKRFYYRTDDETLTIGDRVLVPYGRSNRIMIAEIVCVEKHRRPTAPFPVDKTKRILRRAAERET